MHDDNRREQTSVKDHNFDSHFAAVVMVAFVCYVGLILLLFPHHDEAGPAPGITPPAAGQPAGAPSK
jgi:hypothetical protein